MTSSTHSGPGVGSPFTIMALDLGTTGNRALLFDQNGQILAQAYRELPQIYPQPGWLEHDPQQIWQDTLWAMRTVLQEAGIGAEQVAAIGLAVQRETCLLWDPTTGQPLHNAIVWQDRRTAPLCQKFTDQGLEPEISERTGLVLDAYFSASKLAWLRDYLHPQTAAQTWERVLAGTIDSWAIWNLSGGSLHVTDDSNASRTLLYNLHTRQWDPQLCQWFGIPMRWLPQIRPSVGIVGYTTPELLGAAIPIAAIFGDQQAALFAHGCDRPGLMKCTYGTGSFLVAHTGSAIARSQHRLLSTLAWTSPSQPAGYALEGSMFTSGACIQWLRDGLQIIHSADETAALAQELPDNGGLYFVPALSGLGAPHWDMSARGAFFGLTAGSRREHLVRAVLESIAYQVKEVVDAVAQDMGSPVQRLKVDGGACRNDFLMQWQANVLGIPVERPQLLDATAQGAAFAAGLAVGLWEDYSALVAARPLDRIFEPDENSTLAQACFHTWKTAVARAKHWPELSNN
ncbi:MAG: glycerol kinase GlpK [Thermostichus sp. DRC_bins_24]